MEHNRVRYLRQEFDLEPHPEGGYYKEVYRGSDCLKSPKNNETRHTITHIYFLLTEGDISRWHSVIHDEIWNVYEGDPLRIIQFDPEKLDEKIQESVIGFVNNKLPSSYHKVVKGGDYQAASSTGSYTFLGCTVAPGFSFEDFKFVETEKLKQWIKNQEHDYARFL